MARSQPGRQKRFPSTSAAACRPASSRYRPPPDDLPARPATGIRADGRRGLRGAVRDPDLHRAHPPARPGGGRARAARCRGGADRVRRARAAAHGADAHLVHRHPGVAVAQLPGFRDGGVVRLGCAPHRLDPAGPDVRAARRAGGRWRLALPDAVVTAEERGIPRAPGESRRYPSCRARRLPRVRERAAGVLRRGRRRRGWPGAQCLRQRADPQRPVGGDRLGRRLPARRCGRPALCRARERAALRRYPRVRPSIG